MDHLSAVGDHRLPGDFVFGIARETLGLDEMKQESGDVFRVHLAGMIGDGGRQVHLAQDRHSIDLDRRARLSKFAIPAVLGRQIHDHRAGPHGLDHRRGDEDGRLFPGDCGRRDDNVMFGDDLQHQFPLSLIETLVLGLGVSAFVLRVFGFQIQLDEFHSQALDLFLCRRAQVIGRHDGAEAVSGRDCLQPRHPRADHKNAGGGDRARRGHEHREHSGKSPGAQKRGPIARDRRH